MGRAELKRLAEQIASQVKTRKDQELERELAIFQALTREDVGQYLAYVGYLRPDGADLERGRRVREITGCVLLGLMTMAEMEAALYPEREAERVYREAQRFEAELASHRERAAEGYAYSIRWLRENDPDWQEPKTEYQTWAEGARQTMAEVSQSVQQLQQAQQGVEQPEPAPDGAVRIVYEGYLADNSFSLMTVEGPRAVVRGKVYTVPAGVFESIQAQEAENRRQAEYASQRLKRPLKARRPDWRVVR